MYINTNMVVGGWEKNNQTNKGNKYFLQNYKNYLRSLFKASMQTKVM